MNIKTSDLRKFQKLASNIKSVGIMPIADYLKFGGGKIVKTAFSSFIEYDCKDADEDVLVDEQALNSLVSITPSEFINITSKGNKTTISDTRDKIPFQVAAVKDFPLIPTPESEKFDLSPEFLEAIGMAANFSDNMGTIPHYYMYLHIGEGAICAGDGIFGFYSPIKEDFKLVLEKRIAQLISKHNTQQFARSDRYFFFYSPGVTMGFSQQEMGWADLRKFLIGGDKLTFTVSASDIGSYCSLAMQLAEKCVVTISTGKFEMYDMLRDRGVDRAAENLVLPEPFTFNPSKMNTLIAALGVDELDFYDGKGLYYIKNQELKSIAIIAKSHKP